MYRILVQNWRVGNKISITTGDSSIDFIITKRLGQDQGIMREVWLIKNKELNVKFVVKNPLIDYSNNWMLKHQLRMKQ